MTLFDLTRTTAIVGALSVMASAAQAQPYEDLAGTEFPPCTPDAEARDGASLGPDAFPQNARLTPGTLLEALRANSVCISAEGKILMQPPQGGTAAAPAPETEQPAPEQPAAEVAAPDAPAPDKPAPESDAPASEKDAPASEKPATAEGLAETLPAPDAPATDTPAADTTAESTPETMKPDPGEPAPAVSTQPTKRPEISEITAPDEKPTPDSEVTAPIKPEPTPASETEVTTPPPGETLALTESEGATDVSETTLTDENTRSSDEDFADKPAANDDRDGLSAFEKFAIGAAGAVVAGALLNNREVVSNTGDRVVVRGDDGNLEVLRDDDTLLRRPGSDVRTERFADGSTRRTVTRPDGSKIVTIADATGRVLKRTRIDPQGRESVLIDDTEEVRPVDVTALPSAPRTPRSETETATDREALRAALRAEAARGLDRTFTLRQIREFPQVRSLMPEITLDSINFATGSAAITSQEAEELFELGQALSDFLRENPDELFLIEGHTDAVGDAAYNLTLSDRRAESVALALTEYFKVPPENMIIQGYGESELKVPTQSAERANRRATVRRITPLLR